MEIGKTYIIDDDGLIGKLVEMDEHSIGFKVEGTNSYIESNGITYFDYDGYKYKEL